jgi:CBS domain-containing protein
MTAVKSHSPSPTTLPATLAEDLMTANPISLQETLTAREARNFFIDKAISGAPVIDDAGRPVGVLSQTDLLIHDREGPSTPVGQQREAGDHASSGAADTLVRDVMTQGVFSVGRHAPIERVIGDLCGLNVHRLFVVDAAGVLVGVISAMDVLRHLTPMFRDGGGHR